jgi:hypothetical protein
VKDVINKILTLPKKQRFPRMMGLLDCINWVWKNTPVVDHGQYSGLKKNKWDFTVVLSLFLCHLSPSDSSFSSLQMNIQFTFCSTTWHLIVVIDKLVSLIGIKLSVLLCTVPVVSTRYNSL